MTSKRILIVDDDEFFIAGAIAMIQGDFDIKSACDGREAVAILESENANFDVIISDLSMPDVNGASLYLYIAEHFPHLESRVIFVTGGIFGSYLQALSDKNKNPCLQKPMTSELLNKTIAQIINREGQ